MATDGLLIFQDKGWNCVTLVVGAMNVLAVVNVNSFFGSAMKAVDFVFKL